MVIHTCKISALRKMQQEEANLDYIARPCLKKKTKQCEGGDTVL